MMPTVANFGNMRGGVQIRSVLAPNPSMMTQNGTNTYIVGSGRVAVIDPGPKIEAHKLAIFAALLPGESISHILVTHTHLDHSELAADLAQASGAPIYAFGGAVAGRSKVMQRLAARMEIAGGEGVDHAFHPNIALTDGDRIIGESWTLEAIHTPGHMGNHLCFGAGDTLFCGDHVMGWSTSLISPPDGDMTDYMDALQKLEARQWSTFLAGHGAAVTHPAKRLADLIAHRRAREAALIGVIRSGVSDIRQMTNMVYPDLAAPLIPAARRNVLAHLIDLEGRNLVLARPYPSPDAVFDPV